MQLVFLFKLIFLLSSPITGRNVPLTVYPPYARLTQPCVQECFHGAAQEVLEQLDLPDPDWSGMMRKYPSLDFWFCRAPRSYSSSTLYGIKGVSTVDVYVRKDMIWDIWNCVSDFCTVSSKDLTADLLSWIDVCKTQRNTTISAADLPDELIYGLLDLGKISSINVNPPPNGDHGDLLSKAKQSEAVWGVYGPGAVVAWQFSILLAIIQGLHLSFKPPTPSPPIAKPNALLFIAELPIHLGRLLLQDLEFILAILLPAIAACDVLLRTSGPGANFQVTDFRHLTKFLSFSSSPWLDLHAEPRASHPGQLWVGVAPHVPSHIVELLAGDIQTLQSCVALMEFFLKLIILFFVPIIPRLFRPRSPKSLLLPWELLRLLLGSIAIALIAAAGWRLRGYPAELGFSEETHVQLSQGLVSMSRMDPTATTKPDLFSADLALWMPCYPTLLRWLFNPSVLHPSAGRADLPGQWYLGPFVMILFLLVIWMAVVGVCFRFSARYNRYARIGVVVCLPPIITVLAANLLLLCIGPFLLGTGLLQGWRKLRLSSISYQLC